MPNAEWVNDVRSDYDSISATYARSYEINPLSGVADALRGLIAETGARQGGGVQRRIAAQDGGGDQELKN